MTFSPSLMHRLFHNNRIILLAFGMYGLVAGSLAYVAWESPRDFYPTIYLYMNLPVMLIAAFIELYFGNPLAFVSSNPGTLIPLFAALWLLIGSAVYGIVRMLRFSG